MAINNTYNQEVKTGLNFNPGYSQTISPGFERETENPQKIVPTRFLTRNPQKFYPVRNTKPEILKIN